jgi:Uma2 family endonuclease
MFAIKRELKLNKVEEKQLYKHEFIDGEVYAMSGGTLSHNEIAVNLVSILNARSMLFMRM